MSVAVSTVRDRVQAIGREIFDRARHAEPSVFETAWWDQQVLDWAMHHEPLKVQLFRFIDVLPALTAPEQVAEHLQEYFGRDGAGLPTSVRRGVNFASPKSLAARLAAMAARKNALRMARRFIAGQTTNEAIRTI